MGFALCGIISPVKPSFYENYLGWVKSGLGEGLDYLLKPSSIEARSNPKNILPECRSIIIVAYPYAFNNASEQDFRVASYARGRDYHHVIKEKLNQMIGFIQNEVGKTFAFKICCDTSALMEKDLAYQAGFGWIGKNGLLINPTWGSGLLLGEILLDIELMDESFHIEDKCNDCQTCIQACPSQCITPHRIIQANRCNSFQSIEYKGEITLEQRNALRNWVFGCDICQIVCPFNLQPVNACEAQTSDYPDFFRSVESGDWLLKGLFSSLFEREFNDSAMRRIRKAGLIRNCIVVIGTQKLIKYLPFLKKINESPEHTQTQKLTEWAMNQIQQSESTK